MSPTTTQALTNASTTNPLVLSLAPAKKYAQRDPREYPTSTARSCRKSLTPRQASSTVPSSKVVPATSDSTSVPKGSDQLASSVKIDQRLVMTKSIQDKLLKTEAMIQHGFNTQGTNFKGLTARQKRNIAFTSEEMERLKLARTMVDDEMYNSQHPMSFFTVGHAKLQSLDKKTCKRGALSCPHELISGRPIHFAQDGRRSAEPALQSVESSQDYP